VSDVATVTIATQDGPMRAFTAGPPGPPGQARGGIVVVHQAGGLSPQISDTVARLAAEGYHAVGPDFFHRKNMPADFNPMREFGGDLEKFSLWLEGDDHILPDLDAALGSLSDQGIPDSRLGVVGYSWGGRAAFLAAARRGLGAAVSYYGTGIYFKNFGSNLALPALGEDIPTLRTPWLGLFGEHDPLSPPAELDALEAALPQAPVATELVRYPAGHAFDVDMGPAAPPGFPPPNPEVTAAAWARCLGWLDTHIGGSRT
jgi:carboxymethylenebutenolidase